MRIKSDFRPKNQMRKNHFSSPHDFYSESLKVLKKTNIPFMVGGTFAVMAHTGIKRETKDLDVFCHPGDYPKILKIFSGPKVKSGEILFPRLK